MCYNRTTEENIKVCNRLAVLVTIVVVLMVGFIVYDLIMQREISASNCVALASMGCFISGLAIRKKRLLEEFENEKANEKKAEIN